MITLENIQEALGGRKKPWNFLTYYSCPVCCKCGVEHETITDRPRPDDRAERYKYEDRYDYCNEGHF